MLFAVLSACSPPPAPEHPPLITASVIETAILSQTPPPPGGDSTPRGGANPSALPPAEETPPPPERESNLLGEPAAEITVFSEACTDSPVCSLSGRFLLQRPVLLTGPHSVERSYPYGSTQDGKREVHHGVEFYNPQGTPVLAATDGQVVFAGDDGQTLLAWVPALYGNVIVLEHLLAGEKLYTLYGHLSRVGVSIGQAVKTGEPIGKVGASGTAIGSHLHFEVRRRANDYFSTRNP